MRNLIAITVMVISSFITVVLLFPVWIYKLLNLTKFNDTYRIAIVQRWAKLMLWASGVKGKVNGMENLPTHNKICFISNHQSYFDIWLIVAKIPKVIGFITKSEMRKIPMLPLGMRAIGCVFIDRKKKRESLMKIKRRVQNINKGNPMLIFPEGKRSKSSEMQRFRTGGLQYVVDANVVIVPLTVCDTYKIYEEHNSIKPSKVKLTIHKPIDISLLDKEGKKMLFKNLEETIRSANI